jgi:MFS family permease
MQHSTDVFQIIPVIASIYNLAAGVMSLCVTFYGMQIGRKGTILLGCLLICIGALLQASTYSVGQIIAGRIVTGAGIGNIAAAVPTYMVCFEFFSLQIATQHLLTIIQG